jgi:Ca2+-binding EF-hand superfamily protein
VKEVLEGSVATVERQLSEALEAALAEFDADGNGIVTVAELLDSLANPSRLASRQRVLPMLEAAQKASDAILQARSFVDETVRLVDEDGDGVITLAEAVRGPKRLFDQWWSSVNK